MVKKLALMSLVIVGLPGCLFKSWCCKDKEKSCSSPKKCEMGCSKKHTHTAACCNKSGVRMRDEERTYRK